MTKKSIFLAIAMASGFAVFPLLSIPSTAETASNVTLTGLVTCSRCYGDEVPRKGYTPYSWAFESVSQGDDIVFVVGSHRYLLLGDKEQIMKYIAYPATVSGILDGNVLTMEKIARPEKKRK
jgi:hypothetical protein